MAGRVAGCWFGRWLGVAVRFFADFGRVLIETGLGVSSFLKAVFELWSWAGGWGLAGHEMDKGGLWEAGLEF
jgi:hypothetical protein